METKPHIAEIKALTGLRGVAACWVVLYHFHSGDALPLLLKRFILHGYLAVDLFFVLSGFVMALTYERFFAGGWTRQSYGVFLLRRFARIYPLYVATTLVVALSICLGLSSVLPREGLGLTLLLNLLLVQAWGFAASINNVAWSISTEFAAYLLFPVLTFVLLRTGRRGFVTALLCCVAVVIAVSQVPLPAGGASRSGLLDVWWPHSIWPLIRCLSEFCLGLATWRASHWSGLWGFFSHPAAGWILAALLAVFALWPDGDVAFVLLLPPFILHLSAGHGAVAKGMGARAAFFLGEISYAMYLMHWQFMRLRGFGVKHLSPHIGDVAADAVALLLIYGALLAFSWAVYWLFEKPARRVLRGLERFM